MNTYKIGIDVGSTTLKVVVLDQNNDLVHKAYKRHKADINTIFTEELNNVIERFPESLFNISITGSAGVGISERTGIPFVQEVVASIEVVKNKFSDTYTLIDLGGEDAKMVFFEKDKQPDIRMNGSCAGGTGAFIDQMADLMNISVEELGKQAQKHKKLYPIASRCGVFAKTDVQNLIARNVSTPDIAMSILQTVALQSITSLARGYDIKPKVLCIGGPLTFIPALRDSFRKLLKMNDDELIQPENSEYFPAWGTALSAPENEICLHEIIEKLNNANTTERKDILPPLFNNETEYLDWKNNRRIKPLRFAPLSCGEGQREKSLFLGIDSGSTTTKILIMDTEGNVVYAFYGANEGNPLKKVIEGLQKFYDEANSTGVSFKFLSSCATGYGEELIKSALGLDYGIVETMAHLSGAQYVDPEVSFVLDIGGQDIKSIFTSEGVISNIELNEACSSGCGSFLQNFASTMNISLPEFAESACLAKFPCDLGSRCTVFMNSKVKQSLREGASLGDISAGLAYSVVKNCLFKVLKISNLNQLGNHIVVQGGTFRNDSVYRALELLSEKSVSSTDHPELMGALGAALYAQKMFNPLNPPQGRLTKTMQKVLLKGDLGGFSFQTKELHCKGCSNNCSIIRFDFENGNTSYAGNKCEKIFFSKNLGKEKGLNFFDTKNKLLFERTVPLSSGEELRERSKIGIPRVLNIFENYPFWHTLLAECGFDVIISPESTFPLYQKGVGSVMSENICFPAKLVHGHIQSLVEIGVDRIFYPIVPKDEKEFTRSTNSFNCPVVSGYPDVIKSSMDPEERFGIPFDKPVITFSNDKALKKACLKYVSSLGVSKKTFNLAFEKALAERQAIKAKLKDKQKALLDKVVAEGKPAFIVAGRPYHADPLIHQKVGQILSDLGVNVFTDDVFRKAESEGFSNLNLVSQWAYPNRVVQAAMEVAKLPQNVQLIQLNSFGCGPDSFFMDEIGDVLRKAGKNHTILRIDEIASPGSIRLRCRSLVESLRTCRDAARHVSTTEKYVGYNIPYTTEDKKKTILIPWFADFLSPFIPIIGELGGYNVVNLPKTSKEAAEIGLKYGHNEVCYPSTLVLGDIIKALQSGEYDVNNVVIAITQTGGQCRATNYLAQLKSGLTHAGFGHIPVVAVGGEAYQNEQDDFKLPVFKLTGIAISTLLFADALQQMYNSTIIREKNKGETQKLFDFYIEKAIEIIRKKEKKGLHRLLEQAVVDFNKIPIYKRNFTKIGLIGEIYIKYNNYGQAHITKWLQSQQMEVVTPPILDFFMQYFVNSKVDIQNGLKKASRLEKFVSPLLWNYVNRKIKKIENIIQHYRFHYPTESVYEKAEYAAEILDLSNQFGEGWLVAAEVACYAHAGINKVVCIQPFGCIANHVVAKGIEKRLRKFYPNVNLLYLDIDGGVAEVNLQNRLHFMINE